MAKVFIEETTLTSIGDAIRDKTGKTDLIDPANMGTEIASIETGGGGDLPEEALSLTGECTYKFYGTSWKWYIDSFGNKITTHDITNLAYAFKNNTVEEIPFTLYVNRPSSLVDAFFHCGITKCPKIRGTLKMDSGLNLAGMLTECYSISDLEDLFESSMLEGYSNIKVTSASSAPDVITFEGCTALRNIPSWWYNFKLRSDSTAFPRDTTCLYYKGFTNCKALTKATDIPVWSCQAAQTSNMFYKTFDSLFSSNAITFETNNGQPIEVKWKAQVIDLTKYVGYVNSTNISGRDITKRVTDDTSYQALKNDPDWWSSTNTYGKYDHDSAVETINSLPDTSAYLATASGTNTIKFDKYSGYNTDGGSIDTLTAEEIAVAAAKGWTVTLS
jgi:hypothetical protein